MDISFITMSNNTDKEEKLRQNLRDIFGSHPEHKYEILVADGDIGDGLCAGYNKMAKVATYDTFVFLHNDITLLCNDKVLEVPYNLCQKVMTGWCGVAGTRYLPESGCWWKSPMEDCRGAVYHPSPNRFGMHLNVWPHTAAQFSEVAVCDGAFLMCSRRTFQRIQGFDSEAYYGLFHGYDVDATFRATLAGLTNWVCPIPIFHSSPGRTDSNYEVALTTFRLKFSNHLPYRI